MGVRKRIFILGGAIGAGILAIAVGLILWGTSPSLASPDQAVESPQDQQIQLDQAANQADDFSEAVYSGLDTTKEIIGKTEARNQAIEHGRSTASAKLEDLGDRARQAASSGDQVLSETDKRILKHISE